MIIPGYGESWEGWVSLLAAAVASAGFATGAKSRMEWILGYLAGATFFSLILYGYLSLYSGELPWKRWVAGTIVVITLFTLMAVKEWYRRTTVSQPAMEVKGQWK